MDILKKKQDIISKRIEKPKDKEDGNHTTMVCLLNDNDIVFVGKTSLELLKYVIEKKSKYNFTHYYSESILTNEIDNFIAELILEMQPIYNKNVLKNTKYISNNFAKEKYHIHRADFRKVYNEFGGYKFGSTLYITKQLFDDIYAISEPYSIDMPKVGTFINLDTENYPKNIYAYGMGGYSQEYDSFSNEKGNTVEQITHVYSTPKEDYDALQSLLEESFEVVELINSETFEVFNHKTKLRKEINVSDDWFKTPDGYTVELINNKYLESLKDKQDEKNKPNTI